MRSRMIQWKPGLVIGPDRAHYRQLPQRHVYSSAVYVRRDGLLRRRHYNSVSEEWTWNEPMSVVNDEDRVGYRLEGNIVSVERCIAMAWRRRHEDSKNSLTVAEGKPAIAKYVRWEREEDCEEEDDIGNERWRPLKWRVGLVWCNPHFSLSSRGRLRDPHGSVTRGFFFDGTRVAAVDGLLVDLLAASGLRDRAVPPPRIRLTLAALCNGMHPDDVAVDVTPSTTWGYFAQAATYATDDELQRYVKPLIDPKLWHALRGLRRRDDPILGGALKPLMAWLRESGVSTSYEHLWLARVPFLR